MRAALHHHYIQQSDLLIKTLSPGVKKRVTTNTKKYFLLRTNDPFMYDGIPYTVKWKSLGAGVHEASLVLWEDK